MQKVVVSTPRGTIVKGPGGAKAQLIWNDNIKRFNGQYSRAQVWLDNEVLKSTTKFVPMLTGALFKSGQLGTQPGTGVVQWIAPYARYLYYGKVMAGPPAGPKYATDKDLVFSKSQRSPHPQAQAFWFEASKALNKNEWIKGARRIAGGG